MNSNFYLLTTHFFKYTFQQILYHIIFSFIIYSFFNNYTSSNIFLFNTLLL